MVRAGARFAVGSFKPPAGPRWVTLIEDARTEVGWRWAKLPGLSKTVVSYHFRTQPESPTAPTWLAGRGPGPGG